MADWLESTMSDTTSALEEQRPAADGVVAAVERVKLYIPRGAPVVYYALSRHDGSIKIGTTKDITGRMVMLWDEGKPRKLLAIEPGSYAVEAKRHNDFADYWIAPEQRGDGRELFEPGEGLIEHINKLLARPHYSLTVVQDPHLATAVELDGHVVQPAHRSRLHARVSETLIDQLWAVAKQRRQSFDDLVEEVLTANTPAPTPLPRVNARVDHNLADYLEGWASITGQSVDDAAEEAVRRYLDVLYPERLPQVKVQLRRATLDGLYQLARKRGCSADEVVDGMLVRLLEVERELTGDETVTYERVWPPPGPKVDPPLERERELGRREPQR